MIMPHSHGHTAVQSLITMMGTCRIWAWTLETFWTFIIQFYSLLTVGWLGAGGRRHIKLIRWPSCRQLKQSLNIIELLPSSHEKCFQRAAESRHNIYSYLHCIVYFPQVTSLEWINSMAINNAANIHIENTNSSLHYKQYITLHYKHYKLLTCLAAPLLGSRGEAAQSAVTREREEHADTGDLAAVDIGLHRSGIDQ